jgi:hypothetical protein
MTDSSIHRRRVRLVMLGALLFASCGAPTASDRSDNASVGSQYSTQQSSSAEVRYISGGEVLTSNGDERAALEGNVGSRFGAGFAPLATEGLDGVLYLASNRVDGSPTTSDLRLLAANKDELLISGCDTFAVRADDAVACSRPTARGSEVVVRTKAGELSTWGSAEEDLVVIGWAGSELILEELHGEAGPAPRILKASKAGATEEVRQSAGVTAISPDGKHLLIDALVDGRNLALIIDTSSGVEAGQVLLADDTTILGAASWTDSGIVAAGFSEDGASQFAVLLHSEGADLVEAGRAKLPAGTLNGIAEPFLSENEGEVGGWTVDGAVRVDATGKLHETPYRLVTCTLATGTCDLASVGSPNDQFGRLRTASRPAAENTSKGEL